MGQHRPARQFLEQGPCRQPATAKPARTPLWLQESPCWSQRRPREPTENICMKVRAHIANVGNSGYQACLCPSSRSQASSVPGWPNPHSSRGKTLIWRLSRGTHHCPHTQTPQLGSLSQMEPAEDMASKLCAHQLHMSRDICRISPAGQV